MAGLDSILGVVGGLLKAHEVRLRNAKNENQYIQQVTAAYDEGLKQLFSDANAGNLTASEAINECHAISKWCWDQISSWQGQAGIAATPCVSNFHPAPPDADNNDGTICNKQCTAGCCVGCNDLDSGIENCIYVFSQGGGTAKIPTVNPSPSKYDNPGRVGYTLTYSPPPLSSALAPVTDSLISPVTEAISSLTGGQVKIPSMYVLYGLLGFGILLLTVAWRKRA